MTYAHRYESPLGGILMTADDGGLTGLRFDDRRDAPAADGAPAGVGLQCFEQADRWLDAYFSGRDPGFTPPLNVQGTAFRRIVWEILLTIPYGRTTTYGAVAKAVCARLGATRMSAQAVGGAVGHNPVALIIPCHRVLCSDGGLTGYAGGLARKQELLRLEAAFK